MTAYATRERIFSVATNPDAVIVKQMSRDVVAIVAKMVSGTLIPTVSKAVKVNDDYNRLNIIHWKNYMFVLLHEIININKNLIFFNYTRLEALICLYVDYFFNN